MAKKFKDVEEAKSLKTSTKEELKVAKTELKNFCKEKGLSREEDADHSADEKNGKKWGKLKAQVTKKEAELAEIEEYLTSNKKEKKASAPRVTKYEYPEGATSADKKKIRSEARAAAKKAAKEAAKAEKGGEKKEKKAGKEEAKSSEKKDKKKKSED